MVFDPKSLGDHSPVVIHDHAIAQINSYRYLGIHIDNKLVWKAHVENICSGVQLPEETQKLWCETGSATSILPCSSGEPPTLWYLCMVL